MLTKFEVTNFKGFNKKITLDLSQPKAYEFNSDCIKDGIISKAIVYGRNGSGKTNLGLAIFDLISHLTDKEKAADFYINYRNASNKSDIAEFVYELRFGADHVVYAYGKTDRESLVYEKLVINNKELASVDRRQSFIANIFFEGAESLKRDLGNSKISIISYIFNNSILTENNESLCLKKLIEFANSMLFFRSLDFNQYIGFDQGITSLSDDIIRNGNVKDFEEFLNKAGVECALGVRNTGHKDELAFDFGDTKIGFFEAASQGTKALTLFYFWYQSLRKEGAVKFLFIDEFDAFYHHLLSTTVVKFLLEINAQVILTTHSTAIMTNDLMRPDCYFVLQPDNLVTLADSTLKELREAHNLEKMYRAGSFNG